MRTSLKKEALDSDPGLKIPTNDTVCTKPVERLRAKLHATKAKMAEMKGGKHKKSDHMKDDGKKHQH